MRIICDTNVLISAILCGRRPRQVLEAVISGRVQGFISPAMEQEFRQVLTRPKFGLSEPQIDLICRSLRDLFQTVYPRQRVQVIQDDPPDNQVLACAVEARADCIVTGDRHLLDLGGYRGVDVVTPAELVGRLG